MDRASIELKPALGICVAVAQGATVRVSHRAAIAKGSGGGCGVAGGVRVALVTIGFVIACTALAVHAAPAQAYPPCNLSGLAVQGDVRARQSVSCDLGPIAVSRVCGRIPQNQCEIFVQVHLSNSSGP